MRPFSLHIVFMGHELAVAFGKSAERDVEITEEEAEEYRELMPVLSDTDRENPIGFRRMDRPEVC